MAKLPLPLINLNSPGTGVPTNSPLIPDVPVSVVKFKIILYMSIDSLWELENYLTLEAQEQI